MKKQGIILAAILLFVVTLGIALSAGTPTKPLEVPLDSSHLIDSKNNTISASFNDYLKALGFETHLENGSNKIKLREDTRLYTFTAFSAINTGGYLCALSYRDQSIDPAECIKKVNRYDSIILKEEDGSTYEITLNDFIEAYPIIASGSVRILVNGEETDGGVFTTNEVLSSFWTGCTKEDGKKICLFISGDEDSDNSLSINHLWISIQGEKELATCPAPITPTVTTVDAGGSSVTKTEAGEVVPPECVVPKEPNCKTFGHCMAFLDMKIANEIFLNKGKPSQVMRVPEDKPTGSINVGEKSYTLKSGEWYNKANNEKLKRVEYAVGIGWEYNSGNVPIIEYDQKATGETASPYYHTSDGKWYNSELEEQKNVYYLIDIKQNNETVKAWADMTMNIIHAGNTDTLDTLEKNSRKYSGIVEKPKKQYDQSEENQLVKQIGKIDDAYKIGVGFLPIGRKISMAEKVKIEEPATGLVSNCNLERKDKQKYTGTCLMADVRTQIKEGYLPQEVTIKGFVMTGVFHTDTSQPPDYFASNIKELNDTEEVDGVEGPLYISRVNGENWTIPANRTQINNNYIENLNLELKDSKELYILSLPISDGVYTRGSTLTTYFEDNSTNTITGLAIG